MIAARALVQFMGAVNDDIVVRVVPIGAESLATNLWVTHRGNRYHVEQRPWPGVVISLAHMPENSFSTLNIIRLIGYAVMLELNLGVVAVLDDRGRRVRSCMI